jgi:hypothetical protein
VCSHSGRLVSLRLVLLRLLLVLLPVHDLIRHVVVVDSVGSLPGGATVWDDALGRGTRGDWSDARNREDNRRHDATDNANTSTIDEEKVDLFMCAVSVLFV